MSPTDVRANDAIGNARVRKIDMKVEVVLPISDLNPTVQLQVFGPLRHERHVCDVGFSQEGRARLRHRVGT